MNRNDEKEKTWERLQSLIELQKKLELLFGSSDYNVFVFGSYITIYYVEGNSDIDLAVYTEDFNLYKRIAVCLSTYFEEKGIACDLFYIDTTMVAPVYCAPLRSKVQFTDYYPEKLTKFLGACEQKLSDIKAETKS